MSAAAGISCYSFLPPPLPLFFKNRGFCYRNLGAYEKAISDYSVAIRLDGSNAAALNNRGYAWRKLGQYDRAVEDYSKSLQIDPNNIKTYNNRGYSYAKKGDFLSAISDYSKVISMDPQNSHAFHNRGISYDKNGQFEEAIADFSRVLELDSSNAVRRGDHRQAVLVSFVAWDHHGLVVRHYVVLPSHFFFFQSPACCFRCFCFCLCVRAAIACEQNAYFNRGSTHDSIGNYEAAIEDYTRALDLDRGNKGPPS